MSLTNKELLPSPYKTYGPVNRIKWLNDKYVSQNNIAGHHGGNMTTPSFIHHGPKSIYTGTNATKYSSEVYAANKASAVGDKFVNLNPTNGGRKSRKHRKFRNHRKSTKHRNSTKHRKSTNHRKSRKHRKSTKHRKSRKHRKNRK